ncbi:hypothetical protein B0H21DRAFT_94485 [Amylocystis lapponica]|nr:hypothetical protein B0H21DRAFT_94485 [Amylocystis lapponica]
MSLLKIPLLFIALWGMHVSATPPVKAEQHDIRNDVPTTERVFRIALGYCRTMTKLFTYIMCGCEAAMILAHAYPASPIAALASGYMIWGPTALAGKISLSPTFLISWSVLMLGSLLRLSCYRELGRFFTFEVTLCKDHQLVTSGPYAVVRHPSYVGSIIVLGSTSPCFAGPGSWMKECGVSGTAGGKIFTAAWVVSTMYTVVHLLRRPPLEDRILEKEFGDAWREWARRVPWRLIPGIY